MFQSFAFVAVSDCVCGGRSPRDRSNPFTRNLFGNLSLTSPTRRSVVECSATALPTTSTPSRQAPGLFGFLQPVAWETALSRRLNRTCVPGRKVKRLLHAEGHGRQALRIQEDAPRSKEHLQNMCKPWWIQTFRRRRRRQVRWKPTWQISLVQKESPGFNRRNGAPRFQIYDRVCGELLSGVWATLIDNFNKHCCSVSVISAGGAAEATQKTTWTRFDGSGSWTLTDCSIQLEVLQ
ncbi:hypothetical protein QBC39DRAFT_355063 [Podospora conica]|nr:hypothetical protein QBC39DRAFT_355063 [Schizothecium conicum]